MARTNAAAALVDILDREGVRYIFGVPGGPILSLCDEIERHPRMEFVLTKHEQAAAYAAYAYARAKGQLGVCCATLGPGATNLAAGLPVASIESVPVLSITGQVQTSAIAYGAHQESSGWFATPNQEAIFAAICKQSSTCTLAQKLPQYLRHLIRIAYSDRQGPVNLIIPSDVLQNDIDYVGQEPSQYRIVTSQLADEEACVRIGNKLIGSKRPVFLLGGRSLRCGALIERIAELTGAGIVTDLACKSVVAENVDTYLGCIGPLGHKIAESYLKDKADLVVSIGQTFDEISTLSWDPGIRENKQFIQIDVDPQEIGKCYAVDDATVGNLPTILTRILRHIETVDNIDVSARKSELKKYVGRTSLFTSKETESDKTPLLPQRIVAELRAGLPDNALILSDSSKWARWLGRHFQAAREQIISAHDYEPMGWAVAGAIGAKLACPDRPVVCVSGDGAFLMSAMELSTSTNYDVPVVWVVMNDARLGIIFDLQKTLYGGRIAGTTFENLDLLSLARAMGVKAQLITQPTELKQALCSAVMSKQSHLFDVRFDADEIPSLRPRSLLITKNMGLPNPKPGPETTKALIKMLKDR